MEQKQQQKLTLALCAIWLRSLRLDQDRKYIFSIQQYGLTWFKPIKLRYSSNQYVDFTTTFTTPWSRVKRYLFYHETVAVENNLHYIFLPRSRRHYCSKTVKTISLHDLALYYNYFVSQEFQWSLTWFTSRIFVNKHFTYLNVRISQKLKCVIMWNLRHIIFMWSRRYREILKSAFCWGHN